jgi:hypothetical protein
MGDDIAEMKDDLKAVKKNTDMSPQIVKNTDLIPQIADNTEKILEEAKGLSEDQPEYTMQFRQLQADDKAIKEHLGMI